MKKSEIRKKLLKARKLNNNKNLVIKFSHIMKILKKEKVNKKIIGGYYPYNYEVDPIKTLNNVIFNYFDKTDSRLNVLVNSVIL